jgi:hypothetical protein
VSIYITPKDPDAMARGWEYKLARTSTQVADAHLAAGVNGTLFNSKSWYIRLPGDLADAIETAVADHQVNHIYEHTYLFWWDQDKIAHLDQTKPPSAATLKAAVWGIGGQFSLMVGGQINSWAGTNTDRRTMIAADPTRRLVWIVCFDKASFRFGAEFIRNKGATLAMMVDGGTSTAMALGSDAAGGRWRRSSDSRPIRCRRQLPRLAGRNGDRLRDRLRRTAHVSDAAYQAIDPH